MATSAASRCPRSRATTTRTFRTCKRMIGSPRAGLLGSVLVAALGSASAGAAQGGGQTGGAFVFLVGTDTFGIERFTTTPQAVTGEIVLQGQPRVTYFATRAAAGRVEELRVV